MSVFQHFRVRFISSGSRASKLTNVAGGLMTAAALCAASASSANAQVPTPTPSICDTTVTGTKTFDDMEQIINSAYDQNADFVSTVCFGPDAVVENPASSTRGAIRIQRDNVALVGDPSRTLTVRNRRSSGEFFSPVGVFSIIGRRGISLANMYIYPGTCQNSGSCQNTAAVKVSDSDITSLSNVYISVPSGGTGLSMYGGKLDKLSNSYIYNTSVVPGNYATKSIYAWGTTFGVISNSYFYTASPGVALNVFKSSFVSIEQSWFYGPKAASFSDGSRVGSVLDSGFYAWGSATDPAYALLLYSGSSFGLIDASYFYAYGGNGLALGLNSKSQIRGIRMSYISAPDATSKGVVAFDSSRIGFIDRLRFNNTPITAVGAPQLSLFSGATVGEIR